MPVSWRTLLAADDGSTAGRHATVVAERLARELTADLRVVSVLPSVSDPLPAALDAEAPKVGYGVPSIEIVRIAESLGADVVVLGRAGGDGCRPRLGSTADGVVRRSLVPTLFVNENQDQFRRVAVAVDGTDRGMAVLEVGEVLSGLGARQVEILSVEPPPESAAAPPPGTRVRLLDAVARFRFDPAPTVHVLHGEPTGVLVDHLARSATDLLVIGVRHGAGGVSTGVGRELLCAAPCALLTVPI
ncbi:MAG: universal stress protein [Gemmatimonadota bacterium]